MNKNSGYLVIAVALAVTLPTVVYGAGFNIFEQGTRAMGTAGAFTATADDPSAIFHNPAGLAFQRDEEFYGGVTLIAPSAEFRGDDPYPGTGNREEMESALFHPVAFYYNHPVGDRISLGLGFFTPFGLATEWANPDTFSGRFISQRADLQTVSLQPTAAYQVTDNVAIGLGLEYRIGLVELERNSGIYNPFSQRVSDVAHTDLESDPAGALGFSLGALWRSNNGVRFGASYRHHMDLDFDGDAHLSQIATGNPELDAIVAATIPFGTVPVETSIAFPAIASVGAAWDMRDDLTIEVNANWMGWNRFQDVNLVFPSNQELSEVIPQNYENAWSYRVGFEKRLNGSAFRGGYVHDQSPQPLESSGPLLPDTDRDGLNFGYGRDFDNFSIDLAYMLLLFSDIDTQGRNRDGFNGQYESIAHLVGFHLRYRF